MVQVGGIVSVGGGGGTSTSSGSTSGVVGVNGITVEQVGGSFVVDGAALSGLLGGASNCFTGTFGPTTSGRFSHGLGTRSLVVQVLDDSGPPRWIMPDHIIYDDLDTFSVLFNRPQTGTVVAVSCTGPSVTKYAEAFTDITSLVVTHSLGTIDVMVQIRNSESPSEIMIPDKILVVDPNTVTLKFNTNASGRVVVTG